MPTTATPAAAMFAGAAFSPAFAQEAQLSRPITLGDTGDGVRRVQEWLTLGKIGVKIDGVFGAATETAVKLFQEAKSIPATGSVDDTTFTTLVSPIQLAATPIAPSASFGADVVRCGEQHIAQHPREVGGPNAGPWVRLYMDGDEGTEFPWCAGFTRFLMRQAAAGRELPFKPSVSCDEIGQRARQGGFLRDGATTAAADIRPGSLFLVRRQDRPGWHHTGIVVAAADKSITTFEGNTNDTGSREGFEAIRRVRARINLDFVVVPN